MTQEHYNKLDALMKAKLGEIEALLRDPKTPSLEKPFGNVINRYEQGLFPRSEKVKDLQKRFNFDFFSHGTDREFVKELYTYLNDDHIETALKRIMPKIERKY